MSEGCKKQVWATYHAYPCSRKAWKDGYCKQHHPDTVAARDKKRKEKWELDDRIRNTHSAIRDINKECVALVVELAGENKRAQALAEKRAALKKQLESLEAQKK